MSDIEKKLNVSGESESKLTEAEVIDLKKELLQIHLIDSVAAAYSMEHLSIIENETDEQTLERVVRVSAKIGVILGQNVMRPGAEWEEGVPQPEDFLPHVRLQGALMRSMQIPKEIAHLHFSEYPDEWGEWHKGLRPNPYLTETDIELLQANEYSVLLEQRNVSP